MRIQKLDDAEFRSSEKLDLLEAPSARWTARSLVMQALHVHGPPPFETRIHKYWDRFGFEVTTTTCEPPGAKASDESRMYRRSRPDNKMDCLKSPSGPSSMCLLALENASNNFKLYCLGSMVALVQRLEIDLAWDSVHRFLRPIQGHRPQA